MIPAFLFLVAQQAASQIAETSLPERSSFLWADVDGDGRLDLAAVRAEGSVQLLLNAGAGRFEDATERFGLAEVADAALLAWADYDADGRLDVFVGARAGASRLYRNEGGTFVDMSAGSGLMSTGSVQQAYWLDHDGDARLDLVVLTAEEGALAARLFRGLEGGFFEASELPALGGSPAAVLGGVPLGSPPEPGVTPDGPPARPGKGKSGGRVVSAGPSSAGSLAIAPPPNVASVTPIASLPTGCANSVRDQANPGTCVAASTTPTLGELYPLSTNLFVAVGGNVGVGTVAPGEKLDVVGNAKVSNTVTAKKGTFGLTVSASGAYSTVSGGRNNTASGYGSTVSGGKLSAGSGPYSTVSGGGGNTASAYFTTVSGGFLNSASGARSTVSGGDSNTAGGDFSFAAGRRAKANHQGSFVWGDSVSIDKPSSANDQFNVYAEGGARVFAVGQTTPSMVVDPAGRIGIATSSPLAMLDIQGGADQGGAADPVAVSFQHRLGGFRHFIRSRHNSVANDLGNAIDFFVNSVATSSGSSAPGVGNTMVMSLNGAGNVGIGTTTPSEKLDVSGTARAEKGIFGVLSSSIGGNSTVSGGQENTASSTFSTVSGGWSNDAVGNGATVSGGQLNEASGVAATVAGGDSNTASGAGSFAAGRQAKANHQGSFVWGDYVFGDKTSSANNQFNVYASGGVRMFSNSAATAGVLLAPGGGSWSSVSDRAAKENIDPVDVRAVLEGVCALPISTWNYEAQDDSIRHMGPMAQDFHGAFGLGVSDKTIDTIDPDGVALAAIQGLNTRLSEAVAAKDAEIAELRERVTRLESIETELESLRATLQDLADGR